MVWSSGLTALGLLLLLNRPGSVQSAAKTALPAPHPARAVPVPAGRFRPPEARDQASAAQVPAFRLDETPVTNEDFLRFVARDARYRRGRISPLFADAGYLSHWAGALDLGDQAKPRQPVVRVSWFAAKAYCQSVGKRLPRELEWEYVAAASEDQADARGDPAWKERVLSWYGKPSSHALAEVGESPANHYGVRDLHGLVWEWVLDWNSTLVTSDSRNSGSGDTQAFCGAGAIGFGDSGDYASFMRRAFRSSLTAAYTSQSLGFRCAEDDHVTP